MLLVGRYGFDCGLVVIQWMESIVKEAGEDYTVSLPDFNDHTVSKEVTSVQTLTYDKFTRCAQ